MGWPSPGSRLRYCYLASPDAANDATAWVSLGQDVTISLVGEPVNSGAFLDSLAREHVPPLRGQAVVGLAAEDHHAVTTPLCLEQPHRLFVIQPAGLATLLCWVPRSGPQPCHDIHDLPCHRPCSENSHGNINWIPSCSLGVGSHEAVIGQGHNSTSV